MNRKSETDLLCSLEWSQLYSDIPECVENGMNFAFRRISAREQRRKKAVGIAACAACICLAAGIGAAVFLNRSVPAVPDTVAPQAAEAAVIRKNDVVLTSNSDRYFHRFAECPGADATSVEVKVLTALEFDKEPCPVCCANTEIAE